MATRKRAKTTRGGRKTARRRTAAKRTRVSPKGDTRFVRRNKRGQFKESDDAGRSLAQDRRRKSKRSAKSGQGDRGDRRRRR